MSTVGKNILYNFGGQATLALVSLVAVHFIFKALGADALGVIFFTATLNGVICAALEMGVCATTVREIATHRYDDPHYVHDLIRTASLFYWCAYLAFAIVVYLLAPMLVSRWIHLSTITPTLAVHMIRVLGVTALTALTRSLYASLFRGLQRMELNNGIDAAAIVLQQLGIVAILRFGGSVAAVVDWYAAVFILWTATYVTAAAAIFSPRTLLPGFSARAVRRNLRFTLNMAAISAISVAHIEADSVIVSKLLPISTLGYYSVVARMVRRVNVITAAIAQAAYPSLSTMIRQDRRAAFAQYLKLHDLICFGTIPVFAGFVYACVPVATLLFNREVAASLLLPVTLLAIGHYMNGTLTMPYIFSLAAGKPEIASRQNVFALFASLPVAVALVRFYGLTGAGLSWIVYHLFAYAYGLPRICRECLEIKTITWLRHVGQIATLALVTYGVVWRALLYVEGISPRNLILAYMVASTTYLAGAYTIAGSATRRIIGDLVFVPRERQSRAA
jgi:O-antigen/teichoic acid export membrane protein